MSSAQKVKNATNETLADKKIRVIVNKVFFYLKE